MDPVRLPTKIDEPHQFLLWSADEIIPLMVFLLFGVMLNQAIILTVLGLILTHYYKKYKNSRPDGFLLHALYWAGLIPSKNKTMVNPFKRRFLP